MSKPDHESPAAGAAAQHAALGLESGVAVSKPASHPEAAWFPEAGLGLMVHWGLASVHGGLDLSWGMIANTPWDAAGAPGNKITPREYWRLAERFLPAAYDPEPWVAAAARAGFRYAVFTAMHHDGYTLWPSACSDFGVQSHLGGWDLVAPFVEACRRHGLKVGLYLSPPDWHFDREVMSFNYPSMGGLVGDRRDGAAPVFDQDHRPSEISAPSPGHLSRRRALFHARIHELLTRYGRIDLLWFDGGVRDNDARDLALALQPHLVINSRSCDGHYDCTECHLPSAPPTGWFETVHCWQSCEIRTPRGAPVDVWGYLKTETYKSAAWAYGSYRQLRGWGGNFLLNVGPRPDGSMPGIVLQRLAEFQRLNRDPATLRSERDAEL